MRMRFLIERKLGAVWEEYAFPGSDVTQALSDFEFIKRLESRKRYKGELRLVKETREIIKTQAAGREES